MNSILISRRVASRRIIAEAMTPPCTIKIPHRRLRKNFTLDNCLLLIIYMGLARLRIIVKNNTSTLSSKSIRSVSFSAVSYRENSRKELRMNITVFLSVKVVNCFKITLTNSKSCLSEVPNRISTLWQDSLGHKKNPHDFTTQLPVIMTTKRKNYRCTCVKSPKNSENSALIAQTVSGPRV